MFMVFFIVWLGWVSAAQAGNSGATLDYVTPAPEQAEAHRKAEYQRLADRLHYLVKKNNGKATRKIYLELAALGLPLSYADLLIGAQVHRAQGNVQGAYLCLQEAARMRGTREVIDWLVAIDTQYGRVELAVENGMPRVLKPERVPILPDQKAAIELAQALIGESGTFEGFLPRGVYTLAEQRFELRSGRHTLELRLRHAD
jgi:hypothetical protein